jgi:hypothetical protein
MLELPRPEIIHASAIRFLIDGEEYDEANILLACALELSTDSEKDSWGNWEETVSIKLKCPRFAYNVLSTAEAVDEASSTFVDRQACIFKALKAVLPYEPYRVQFSIRAELIEVDPDWRDQLIEIAKGRGVYNQGVSFGQGSLITWYNLRFRSQSEKRIAEALDNAKVFFLPNCLGRLGLAQRENREADFLVCYQGKWGIIEVDGEPFHPPSRTVQDHTRDRLFKSHGIKVVEHYDATKCYNTPDDVVREFLEFLTRS